MDFDLEYAESVEPCDEAWERGLSRSADADQQQVALLLAEDPVDAQHVLEDLVEEHERHVQLLLVEHLVGERDNSITHWSVVTQGATKQRILAVVLLNSKISGPTNLLYVAKKYPNTLADLLMTICMS